MSVEGVVSFYEKADTDEQLGKQIAQVEPGENALDEVVKIAVAAGFEVTTNDLLSLEKAVQGTDGEGLSDDELSAVSGGQYALRSKNIKRLDVNKLGGEQRIEAAIESTDPTMVTVARARVRWSPKR